MATNFQKHLYLKANESLKNNLSNFQKQYAQAEGIIVWLVGFSITTITLLIAKLDTSNNFVNLISDVVIISTILTIIFGILHRVFLLLYQNKELYLIIEFDHFVAGYDLPADIIYSKHITTENTSYEQTLILLSTDFKISLPTQDFSNLSTAERKKIHNEVVSLYNERQEKQLDFEVELFEKGMSNLIGKKATSKNKKVKPNLIWRYLSIANGLFLATCITFLLGLLTVITMYFFYKYNNKIEPKSIESKAAIFEGLNDNNINYKIEQTPNKVKLDLNKIDTMKFNKEIDSLKIELYKCDMIIQSYEGVPKVKI